MLLLGNPLLLGLTLVTTLGVHAAGNLMNTLFDFVNGLDGPGSSDLTLVKRVLSVAQVKRLIGWAYGLAAADTSSTEGDYSSVVEGALLNLNKRSAEVASVAALGRLLAAP